MTLMRCFLKFIVFVVNKQYHTELTLVVRASRLTRRASKHYIAQYLPCFNFSRCAGHQLSRLGIICSISDLVGVLYFAYKSG